MHFSSLTTTASWCFPSKGKNSLKHTSNPPELTFSNHKYIASFGFVLRVYLTETNTRGLEAKLCKKNVRNMKNYWLKNKRFSRDINQHDRITDVLSGTYEIKDLSKANGSRLIKSWLLVYSHGFNFLPLFTSFYEVLGRLLNASYLAHYLNKATNSNVSVRLTLLGLMPKI